MYRSFVNDIGSVTIRALLINSSNFNLLNVERIKRTKKGNRINDRIIIGKGIIIREVIAIILAYSVKGVGLET